MWKTAASLANFGLLESRSEGAGLHSEEYLELAVGVGSWSSSTSWFKREATETMVPECKFRRFPCAETEKYCISRTFIKTAGRLEDMSKWFSFLSDSSLTQKILCLV